MFDKFDVNDLVSYCLCVCYKYVLLYDEFEEIMVKFDFSYILDLDFVIMI